MGKSTRVKFGKGKHTTKGILDYVHSDLWGPMKMPSRCLLANASLPLKFLGEAAQTVCYLINRSPSTALDLKTPQEVWTGKAPSLDHLRVFGCSAYAHVKDGKLNKRALKCMFIGYP